MTPFQFEVERMSLNKKDVGASKNDMKTNPFRLFIVAAFIVLGASASRGLAQEAPWLTDYAKAVEQAKAGNKAILLDFTGSDWCGWCMKIDKEVLKTKEFKDYAAKNLVLVEVDFPKSKTQTDAVKKQNEELKQQYKVNGFPTFVLLDKDGKELGQQVGYLEGGTAAFTAKLDSFKKH